MTDTTAAAQGRYVRYTSAVEDISEGEEKTFDRIAEVMRKQNEAMRDRYGRGIRASHAKPFAVLKGELRVLDGLPPELAQGIFANAATYQVLVRGSTVPGEYLDDDVSVPRGMALKILGVSGARIAEDDEGSTQDFLLVNGENFIASGAKTFLAEIAQTDAATPLPEGVKKVVSAVSQVTEKAIEAVGGQSAVVGFYGHAPLHPLGEEYFSQQAFRHGDYIAKHGLFPVGAAQQALVDAKVDVKGDRTALRTALQDFFRTNAAEFELRVQLLTNPDKVEDAHAKWSKDESPFIPVATLTLPPQESFGEERRVYFDEALAFSPAHGLEAHRPLGSIGRARLFAYRRVSQQRHDANGVPHRAPASVADVPD